MSVHDDALEANARYATSFALGDLPLPPGKRLAVVACMDARLHIEDILDLKAGDAHIIRNAGGIVTEDALRSLIISHKLLGTDTIFVINHTDCGMLTFRDEELQRRLQDETGHDASGIEFHAFSDLEGNVRAQVKRIEESPFLPRSMDLHGFVYDVKSGRLNEVQVKQASSR